MRIEVDHTPDDYLALVGFVVQRTQQRRSSWTMLIASVTCPPFAILFATGTFGEGVAWRIGGAIAFALAWVLVVRWSRSGTVIPDSWLGPQTYELRDDGIATTASIGSSLVAWRAVRAVEETADHLFVRLDQFNSLQLPKRALEPHGGAQVVRAEIESRVAQAKGAEAAPAPVALGTAFASPAAVDEASTRGPALARNLFAGLRLFAFLPVEPRHFAPSARQVVLLAAVALGAWIGLDRLRFEAGAEIWWFSVQQVLAVGALAIALLLLLAQQSGASERPTEAATAVAAALPCLVLLHSVAREWQFATWLVPVMGTAVLYRAQRLAPGMSRVGAAFRALLVIGFGSWLFEAVFYGAPEFWFIAESEEISDQPQQPPGDAERDLFRQPDLIDAALSQISPGMPGITETYFIGFAGYGKQRVFAKEVRFASAALGERIDLAGRTALLINAPEPDANTPFATVSGLRRALTGIAKRMNLDEDVLVLFLTSHGGANAELSVAQGGLPLDDLRGAELQHALDDAGIRWRIVVISACHSASFIPHLEDPQTLVATASRADRRSLGCSDERELTYFGEALFRDALPKSDDLIGALALAREVVERHEREEKVAESERSEPQVYIGARMREKLAELKFRPAG